MSMEKPENLTIKEGIMYTLDSNGKPFNKYLEIPIIEIVGKNGQEKGSKTGEFKFK